MTAKDIATKTQDAYSFDRYGQAAWTRTATMLAKRGYSDREIEAILRSKHMRWAGDSSGKDRGVTSGDFLRYADDPRNQFGAPGSASMVELVQQTF